MGKRKIFKIVFAILSIFLCVVFYELLGICVAYKKQPEVSNTTQKETKNGSRETKNEAAVGNFLTLGGIWYN